MLPLHAALVAVIRQGSSRHDTLHIAEGAAGLGLRGWGRWTLEAPHRHLAERGREGRGKGKEGMCEERKGEVGGGFGAVGGSFGM